MSLICFICIIWILTTVLNSILLKGIDVGNGCSRIVRISCIILEILKDLIYSVIIALSFGFYRFPKKIVILINSVVLMVCVTIQMVISSAILLPFYLIIMVQTVPSIFCLEFVTFNCSLSNTIIPFIPEFICFKRIKFYRTIF